MMKIQEITSKFFPKGMNTLADIIGPQGNLLDKLEKFNAKYMFPDNEEPLKVTKTWRWGNGTYDRVKIAYNRKVMQWHKRPRGMHTLFDRKRTWFENDLKHELLDIEKYLIAARREGAIWLDKDTDDGVLEQYLYLFSQKFNELEELLNIEAENWTIDTIDKKNYHKNQYIRSIEDSDAIVPGIVYIRIFMPAKPINVTNNNEHLIQIPFVPLEIHIKIDISKWMAHTINPMALRDGYNAQWHNYFGLGFNFDIPASLFDSEAELDEMYSIYQWPIFHPFINNYGGNANVGWFWKNYCWGNFGNHILDSFMKMDFKAFFVHMNRWLYNYELVGANPLNNIRKCFLGISDDMIKSSPKFFDIVGYNGIECERQLARIWSYDKANERQNVEKILHYCNETKQCAYSAKCIAYKRNTTEQAYANLTSTLSSIDKELDPKDQLDDHEISDIHRQLGNRFELHNYGRIKYMGIYLIWDKYCGDHTDKYVKYAKMFEGKHFNMSLRDQTVIAYLLSNKFFDAYIYIMALTKKAKGRFIVDDTFETALKVCQADMDEYLVSILPSIRLEDLTPEELAKKKMQKEMLQWTNDIRNN